MVPQCSTLLDSWYQAWQLMVRCIAASSQTCIAILDGSNPTYTIGQFGKHNLENSIAQNMPQPIWVSSRLRCGGYDCWANLNSRDFQWRWDEGDLPEVPLRRTLFGRSVKAKYFEAISIANTILETFSRR